jgi:hypothetical protein
MKKIFAIFCIAATAVLSSCVRMGDLDLAPVPDIAFEYTCDGLTLTFNSVVPNTTDVQWEILKTKNGSAETLTTGAGETFTYTFPTPDNYWIKMTGVYEGQEQVVAGKILVAKPSAVKLDDNSFADWDAVQYPDFQLVGDDGKSWGKFDYNADYIFFYVALDTTIPGCTADGAIMNMRIDSDDLTGTGMSTKGLGCDWYLEGNFWNSNERWADWYDCSSGDTVAASEEMPIELGTYKVEGDTAYFEFALSRKKYGIKGSSVGIYFKFYTEDWEDAVYMTCGGKTTYHFALDKTE